MDPVLPVPIPAVTPPAPAEIPISKPKSRLWLGILGGVVLFATGIGTGVILGKQIYSRSTPSPSPISQLSPTPTDPTANWKTYRGETIYTTDGSTTFQIKYPAEWEIEKNILYPLGRLEDKGLETRIILGAGGHGWEGKVETREFPAGTAKYSLVNTGQQISAFASFEKDRQVYTIEIVNLPSARESEYKILFDQILSTFKFLD